MRTNFVLATVVSLTLIGVATPAHAQRGGGARSGGGQVARGTVSTGRAVPRVAPRVVVGSHGYYGSPYHSYYSRPYYGYAQPYYAFRPHVSVGFGLWVGYPVPYPYYYGNYYRYPYPYPYGYSYPYPPAAYGYPAPPYAYPAPNPSSPYPSGAYPQAGYPPAGPVTVQPGTTTGAGVSFEITPVDADVFVDGTYVGRVSNFGPRSQPLSVTPGRHLIEIRRQGYQTLSFDADVAAGQVIPYEGAMQPLVR